MVTEKFLDVFGKGSGGAAQFICSLPCLVEGAGIPNHDECLNRFLSNVRLKSQWRNDLIPPSQVAGKLTPPSVEHLTHLLSLGWLTQSCGSKLVSALQPQSQSNHRHP